jgi:hypothetical protein
MKMKKLLPRNDPGTVDSGTVTRHKGDAGFERIKIWLAKERPRERLLAESRWATI